MSKEELVAQLVSDLMGEHDAIRDALLGCDEAIWSTITPAEGWTIRDQVSHLAYFDDATRRAVSEPDAFRAQTAKTVEALKAGEDPIDDALSYGAGLSGLELLDRWSSDRIAMISAIKAAPADLRMPWYGPEMGLVSALSARTMETWAHGQDIFDTLGTPRFGSPAVRQVCDIGIRARPFAFMTNGRNVPSTRVRVELTGPDGETWTWGPADAEGSVMGMAEDFARVVTQRINLADTELVVADDAHEWMSIAQAYAGPPGAGRDPL